MKQNYLNGDLSIATSVRSLAIGPCENDVITLWVVEISFQIHNVIGRSRLLVYMLKLASLFISTNRRIKYSATSISGGAWDGRNWNWPHSPVIVCIMKYLFTI